jgi:hypothetical protein
VIRIDVSDNIREVTRGLDDLARRQVPFATAQALTDTAKGVQAALQKEIKSVFDRPTPWIQRSPVIERATKSSLTATVGIRDKGERATPAKYLKEHFTGGARGNKPMEVAMRSMGILAPGWLVVPSEDGVKKDVFGNVSPATVKRIIRELQGGRKRQDKGAAYRLFIVRPGQSSRRDRHLAPGIWSVARVGDQSVIKPVFFFVARATYRKVIDLPRIAEEVVKRDFAGNFKAALDGALRTSR